MKKKHTMLIIALLIMTLVLSGCTDPNTNQTTNQTNGHNNNDNNQQNNSDFSFSAIALNTTDLNKVMDQLLYNYTQKPYSMENLTGNKQKWRIQQGVFTTFACNTSRLHQSILEFNSEENASLSISLNEQNLLDQGYSKSNITPLGDASFLLKTTMPFNEDVIDVWSISFSYDMITATLVGFAENRSDMISYAQILEENIAAYLES